MAWDLREPSSMHFASRISVGDSDVILRSPTFSTGGLRFHNVLSIISDEYRIYSNKRSTSN